MAIPYTQIVAEDFDRGVGTVDVPMPAGGTATGNKVGIHTFIETVYSVKDFPTIQACINQAAADGAAVLIPPDTKPYTETVTNAAGVPIWGLGAQVALTIDGESVALARAPMVLYQRYLETIDPSTARLRVLQYLNVSARDGGTYGSGGGNSSHGHFFLLGDSHTPTELVGSNYQLTNYAFGDAGFAAGSSQIYGAGLCRGIEHSSVQGSLQFEATLSSGGLGATSLVYAAPFNESTLGAYRELIDTSISTSAGTIVSFSGGSVVGSGTSWSAGLVGQFFKMTVDDRTLGGRTASAWYKVTGVADSTHLTLETNYTGGACPPFGGAATSTAYVICPGAMMTGYNSTTKALTLAANTVNWAIGNTVQLRISNFSQLACIVANIERTLPLTAVTQDAAFFANSLGAERAGSAFCSEGNFFYGLSFFGEYWAGIAMGQATIDGHHAIELPPGKRLSFYGANNDNAPGIMADVATGDLQFLSLGGVKMTMKQADGSINIPFLNIGNSPTGDVAWGTYVPTITNGANISATTAKQCQWMRVGKVVTVSGQLDITTTAAGSTLSQFHLTLPVASALNVSSEAGGGGAQGVLNEALAFLGNSSDVIGSFASLGTANRSFWFSFTYLIV